MIDPVIEAYYTHGSEKSRVFPDGKPSLEYTRILELLDRLMPPPPGTVLDVGGGPGTYAVPLKARGYEVELIDPVAVLVEQARRDGVDARIGDASDLGDGLYDAVLLFGPMYHLTEHGDRQRALSEAQRVLKPGGTLLATMISRYGTMLCGLYERRLLDSTIQAIVAQDLATGQHRNPTGDWRFFTTAYFDTPEGFEQEIDAAGFNDIEVYGVEGPGWVLPDWYENRGGVLAAARAAERAPSLIGFSLNFLAKAVK